MKGREQKIPNNIGTYQQRDRAEPEEYAEGHTYIGITENNFTNADKILAEEVWKSTWRGGRKGYCGSGWYGICKANIAIKNIGLLVNGTDEERAFIDAKYTASKEIFRETIRKERAVELAFESNFSNHQFAPLV